VAAVVQLSLGVWSRIEALLIEMRHEQDVQLKRSVKIQLQIDALTEHVRVNITNRRRINRRAENRAVRRSSLWKLLEEIERQPQARGSLVGITMLAHLQA
jgi:hypothetical protein